MFVLCRTGQQPLFRLRLQATTAVRFSRSVGRPQPNAVPTYRARRPNKPKKTAKPSRTPTEDNPKPTPAAPRITQATIYQRPSPASDLAASTGGVIRLFENHPLPKNARYSAIFGSILLCGWTLLAYKEYQNLAPLAKKLAPGRVNWPFALAAAAATSMSAAGVLGVLHLRKSLYRLEVHQNRLLASTRRPWSGKSVVVTLDRPSLVVEPVTGGWIKFAANDPDGKSYKFQASLAKGTFYNSPVFSQVFLMNLPSEATVDADVDRLDPNM